MDIIKSRKKITVDEAIKNSFAVDDKELVKFINEIFNTKFDPNTAKVVHLSSEFVRHKMKQNETEEEISFDKIKADMVFSINDKIYGI